MDRIIAIMLDAEHPYSPVFMGWALRKAFEANGKLDLEAGKFILDPLFEAQVDGMLADALAANEARGAE